MILMIEIELDNAVFEEDEYEVKRILECLASRLPFPPHPTYEMILHDANGNHVGQGRIFEKKPSE